MIAEANGIKLYYKKLGRGAPLILLHGNGESHEIFAPLAESLQNSFCLYMPDSRGHGQSQKAPLDYYLMAEDIYCLIKCLGLKAPHLFGFSDGGIIALILASRAPDCISSLTAAGANLSQPAFKMHLRLRMQIEYFFSCVVKTRLMLKQPEITEQALNRITARSLIIAGEKDVFPLKHTQSIAEGIPHSQLLILKGRNHYNYIYDTNMLAPILSSFCLKKPPSGSSELRPPL